ncbi:MAG TPA: HupE/UreJ family protein [Kofleriaceae bacterium]|nr:HupE/UreJ family protein [Kofleriaceae bacterium]
MKHTLTALVLVLAVALVAPRVAHAHPLDLGYLRVTTSDSRSAIQLDLDVNAASILVGVDPATLDPARVQVLAETLVDRSFARAPITTPAGACTFSGSAAAMSGRTVSVYASAECPPGPRHWTFPMVADCVISPRFQLMAKQIVNGSEQLTVVDRQSAELEIAAGAHSSVSFSRFVRDGVEHIGAAPSQWRTKTGALQLPDGIDHILFLLALLLGGGRLRRLVGIATGFTLGHSITLALSALDVVRPPASIIEPLIAASIAFAAAEAFSNKLGKHRWKIATGFGLIHGFGFANALSHLELSTRGKLTALTGFNLGVELGQLVIVLLAAPLVLALHRNKRFGTPIIRVAAALIFLCGVYWMFKRC